MSVNKCMKIAYPTRFERGTHELPLRNIKQHECNNAVLAGLLNTRKKGHKKGKRHERVVIR